MFYSKKILVCGLARSGQAAAKLLSFMGAIVTAHDKNSAVTWGYNPNEFGIKDIAGSDIEHTVSDFDLIIISPGISIYAPFVQRAIEQNIPLWGEAELAYNLCPAPMIAITGTNGKTTVTTLVGEILKQHNEDTVVGGNIGIPLTELMDNLTSKSLVVAEISSFQLETISTFRPVISAVLNITEDHLDRHKTMENYIAMKARIFENQSEDDICVLNYDNDITREMTPPGKVVYFSSHATLKEGVFVKNGYIVSRFENKEANVIELTKVTMILENALAAITIALVAGVSIDKIVDGIVGFASVPHRIEFIRDIHGVKFYNDSKATNVASAIKAIELIQAPIILIGGGAEKDADFTPWVESFGDKVREIILIGETAARIVDTCIKLGFTRYIVTNSLQDAVTLAYGRSKPGDTILLSPACASMDMFKNFEERGDLFRGYVGEL